MIAPKYEKMFVDYIKCYEREHVCPWHEMSKEQMVALYEGYILNNDVLDDYQYYYMANYIITRLSGKSDAHSCVYLLNLGYYPYRFKILDGEVYVTCVKDDEELLLSKLVAINNIDINTLINELINIIPGNDGWQRQMIEDCLHSVGSIQSLPSIHDSLQDSFSIKFSFEDQNGNRIDRELPRSDYYSKTNIRIIIPEPRENLYYETRDDAIILTYNSCMNDDCENMINVLNELEIKLLSGNYSRFIIDIRGNTGGNSNNNNPIIDFLKKHEELELITLVNNKTFSSGAMMYLQLKELGTITIGEELGTPLNHFGQVYIMEKEENNRRIDEGLEPIESNIMHRISRKYFYFDEDYVCHPARTKEEYEAMPNAWKVIDSNPPDVEIIPTLDDYKNKRDTVLEYALNYSREKTK